MDAETIRRLATLSPIDFERCRVAEAERLGARLSMLDKLVESHRKSASDTSSGSGVLFREPKAWFKPVNGAALLDALADTFSRYLVLPAGAADVLARWTVHTHVHSAFEYTPRLNMPGPVKQCGQTLLLDVLRTVVAKGLRTESVTTAVVFRLTDSELPCLLINEYDTFLRNNEELRGALNAGHERGGHHLRCAGDKHEIRAFKTFAPVALAGIGSLLGTLANRLIIIRMERAKPREIRERFDSRNTRREQNSKRKLIRWAQDHRHLLEAYDPDMPGLYDRAADNWRPLFAIADIAGGSWPQRVSAANQGLEHKSDENESAGVLLLADIRRIFKKSKQDTLSSNASLNAWNKWKSAHGRSSSTASRLRLAK
jgi:putative DNA primase/helicase